MLAIIVPGILLPIIIVFIVGFIKCYYTFGRFGIPCAFPLPLIGSYWQNLNKYPHENIIEWNKKLGDVFGAFKGSQPTLYVLAPELMKKILVDDASNFSYRDNNSGHITNEYTKNGLALLDYGKEYKIIRRLMEDSLSPSTIATNFETINSICLNMIKGIRETLNSSDYETHFEEHRKFCMSWGIELCVKTFTGESSNIESLPVLLNHCAIATEEHTKGLLANLSYFYPRAFNWWHLLCSPDQGFNFVVNYVKNIYDNKRNQTKNNQNQNTFLAKLVALKKSRPDIKFLTNKMIIGQISSNVLSGNDIGNVLVSCLHALAKTPQVQQNLRKEMLENIKIQGGQVSYQLINSLKELDAFVKEVLRLYPSAYRLERVCKEDYKHGNITIKSGTCIVIPYLNMHYDARNFEDPKMFDHNRFTSSKDSTENLASSTFYLPFGRGIRSCPAKTFVLTCLKFCVVQYLLHFEFSSNEDMDKPIHLKSTTSGNVLTDEFFTNIKLLRELPNENQACHQG